MARLDHQVISALYGAVDDPARWVSLMDLLRDQMGVESVAAQFLRTSHDALLPIWGTRDSHSERHAALHDSWANSAANPRFRRAHGPLREMAIGSDQRSMMLNAADQQRLREGLAQCGLGSGFWISQQLDAEHHFTIIFHRAVDDTRDLDGAESQVLEAIAPHFRHAVRLWARLAASDARTRLVEQANDSVMTAMVACDRRARVHWSNADARKLLTDGGVLRLREHCLVAAARDDQERLCALIAGHADRDVAMFGGGMHPELHVRARLPQNLAPQSLASLSLALPEVLSRDLVLLTITRPDCTVRYDAGDIAVLFGLTLTEAALAASLATGATVSEFAAARGIAEGTARLHLKRVLAKTGAARQSELVRRICRSVADGSALTE